MKCKLMFITFILSLSLLSCNNWLDVTSNTEMPSEDLFSDETGFKDAVIGVYVKLAKPELYSKSLTWHVNEFLSQNYAVVSFATDLPLPRYEYNVSPFSAYRNSIWQNCYETIANINNILSYEERNREVMNPVIDSLVRGELLGIRALVHFDLLRMFGKGNLAGRPELMDELTIPYSLKFSKYAPPQVTNREFITLLKNDLTEAIRYLEADPFNMKKSMEYYKPCIDEGFLKSNISKRRYRMNYYAAEALMARVLMWEGSTESKAKALLLAEGLIEKCFGNSTVTWANAKAVEGPEWWQSDLLFKDEHLFCLFVEKFQDIQVIATDGKGRSWFDASSPGNTYNVVYLTESVVKEIYEIPGPGNSDWRHTECLFGEGASAHNYSIVKLRQHPSHKEEYSRMMPIIRMSEMFYIAAECRLTEGTTYDRVKALEWLDVVRNHRNIPDNLSADLSNEEIQKEIQKEYRKEFVGEGQVFFYYKRMGLEEISGYAGVMDDNKYCFPLPDDETVLGGRK